jgi:hypothetical protein
MNNVTLRALELFPDQLEAHFQSIPDDYKHWAPASWEGIPSESLTATEQICHVLDIERSGYHVRIDRTLAEDNPSLESLDTYALARARDDYSLPSVMRALDEFRDARKKTVLRLAKLTAEQFDRRATFVGYGAVTLRSLVHYLCSHDQQHLAGLQWLAGKIAAVSSNQSHKNGL